MSSVPMPRDLSEEAVAEWLHNIAAGSNPGMQVALRARAVRALLREKVREAAMLGSDAGMRQGLYDIVVSVDAIVSRVMGEEAPRG